MVIQTVGLAGQYIEEDHDTFAAVIGEYCYRYCLADESSDSGQPSLIDALVSIVPHVRVSYTQSEWVLFLCC
jgi:hypothetical protein